MSPANAAATALHPPQRKASPYLFLGRTKSLCEVCYGTVPAKIVGEEGCVFYQKRCPDHGVQKTLISDDLAYWKSQRDWVKPGDRPLQVQTRTEHGYPWDCGLCADHEQHAYLAIIEINDACNLSCPVCFADSSPHRQTGLPVVLPARRRRAPGLARRTHLPGGGESVPGSLQLDLGTVKRSCVHFVQPDGTIIPFDTYNTFYRPGAPGAEALQAAKAR